MFRHDFFGFAQKKSKKASFDIEKGLLSSGFQAIAGVDEAGRGPLAGPLVACACILPSNKKILKINDSKLLTEDEREAVYKRITIRDDVVWAVSIISAQEIDRLNILRATLLAMQQAVDALKHKPDFVLVDGRDIPLIQIPCQPIIKGDSLSLSIAAASIIAKVTRDRIMMQLHAEYPQYGFDEHKGYGTQDHLHAIERFGVSNIHRKTFAPIARLLAQQEPTLF